MGSLVSCIAATNATQVEAQEHHQPEGKPQIRCAAFITGSGNEHRTVDTDDAGNFVEITDCE